MTEYPSLTTHTMIRATHLAVTQYRQKFECPESHEGSLSAFRDSAESWMKALLQRWQEEDA